MQIPKIKLNKPKKISGIIASYGSYSYESACRISENHCNKLDAAGIDYANTYDGSRMEIFVEEELYELAIETLG